MGSILTTNIFPQLQQTFDVPGGPEAVMPASLYLVGFMFGPLIFAPLSEGYGRKPVLVSGFALFGVATLSAVLARNWAVFLFFRFLCGTFGSPPLSVVGGVIADVFCNEVTRGRVIMAWSAATFAGPLLAPVLTGFVSPALGWRWTFWIALIMVSVSFIPVIALPETFATKILRTRAAKLNKKFKGRNFIAAGDVRKGSLWASLKTTLSRPLRLLFSEMLLALACVYMAFAYAVFYMMVQIFGTIFQGVYKFSLGIAGVAFSIMAIGTVSGCLFSLWYDNIGPRLGAKHPDKRAEYLRLPLACVGGPIFVISLLWLGWTATASVHWFVPLSALIPYGFAYQVIFVAMINYITDAYDIYAASALAACGTTRSIAGALIPLCVDKMLSSLGIAWSCTLLALISALLGFVPFAFIMYGDKIRAASRFSATLKPQTDSPDGGSLARARSLTTV
ncbi:major facilitator superfamily domain-containing protein [Lasiosphaeria ovina]|uniref:Major facilitator superfamily domain-containing protein n=1 Tax=Lasiosphaeria ovina TaxID=92902 RepID=A0AAE0N1M2_9PEZI|nr:major facilitator superfamily domain-containing protein [Lasiosphaeria ovina]